MTGPRVVIVGGGITGLALAFTLLEETERQGSPVDLTLLESADEVGGHARAIQEDGFLVEGGPNGFLDREPETLDLVRALGLESRMIEARREPKRRFILRAGRLCRVPESLPSLLASDALSAGGKLRLLMEPLARRAPECADETVFDFACRRIGREAAETLVDSLVSGICAGDSRVLSVRALFPLMVEMEREHGSLIGAMIARRRRGAGRARLLSFDGGLSTLTREIAGRLGARVRTGSSVGSIARVGAGWRLALADGGVLEADRVVLAVSARVAASLVAGVDKELSVALGGIPLSGVNLVALAFDVSDVPRPLDGSGYLVARSEQLATLGVAWESSLFPGRAPAGMALLRVFLGGARRPAASHLEPPDATDLARRELRRVLDIQAAPKRAWTFRWPDAIAQYTVGHLDRVAAIRDRLRRHEGLEVCGTSYDGVSFNHAIACGRRCARSLAARLADDGVARRVRVDQSACGGM
jgi:oxygen-dependent protoporphyrinogen oxidase